MRHAVSGSLLNAQRTQYFGVRETLIRKRARTRNRWVQEAISPTIPGQQVFC